MRSAAGAAVERRAGRLAAAARRYGVGRVWAAAAAGRERKGGIGSGRPGVCVAMIKHGMPADPSGAWIGPTGLGHV